MNISDILGFRRTRKDKTKFVSPQPKRHLRRPQSKLIVFSTVILVFILASGMISFWFSMRHFITLSKGEECNRVLRVKRNALDRFVNVKTSIAREMASALGSFVASQTPDVSVMADALARAHAMYGDFVGTVSWVSIADSLLYSYSVQSSGISCAFCDYKSVSPLKFNFSLPENYWYKKVFANPDTFYFNVRDGQLYLYLAVSDAKENPAGLIIIGADLYEFIDGFYDGLDEKIQFFLFNEHGEVTVRLNDRANVYLEQILPAARNLSHEQMRTLDISGVGVVTISHVPALGWYLAAISPRSLEDYKNSVTAVFLSLILIIVLVFILFLKSLIIKIRTLEAASLYKSKFLAVMSHEIRTPMNAIVGITQAQLQKEDLPKESQNSLEKIYTSGRHLLGIINDILDMTKIETGKVEINPIEYDVASLINDSVQINTINIGSKRIEFILDVNSNLPEKFYGDELRLKQILNNLLSNAIKYTDTGEVRLGISHCVQSDSSALLRFVIKDTGHGIKPEDYQHLFSEFWRFNSGTSHFKEGTGLGLPITKRLIEMMDGNISVKSEYGKGSVFSVEVKQGLVECPAIGEELSKKLRDFTFDNERQASKLKLNREYMPYGKVLIVDDINTNLFVAKELLKPYGMKIETANSGFEAIDKIKCGNCYNIIFMDHMMPDMDGVETTKAIRSMGYNGVIVALTANVLVEAKDLFNENGFDDFIAKPIDIRRLDSLVNKFVRDRQPSYVKEEFIRKETV